MPPTPASSSLRDLLSTAPTDRALAVEKWLAEHPEKPAAVRELIATLDAMKDVPFKAEGVIAWTEQQYFLEWLNRALDAAAEAVPDPALRSRLWAYAATSALWTRDSLGEESFDQHAYAHDRIRRAIQADASNELAWEAYEELLGDYPQALFDDLTALPEQRNRLVAVGKRAKDKWDDEDRERFAVATRITVGPCEPDPELLAIPAAEPDDRTEMVNEWLAAQTDPNQAAGVLVASLAAMRAAGSLTDLLNTEGMRWPLGEAADACDDPALAARLEAAASESAAIMQESADVPYSLAASAVRKDPACAEAWEAYESAVSAYADGLVEDLGEYGEWRSLERRGKLPAGLFERALAVAHGLRHGEPDNWSDGDFESIDEVLALGVPEPEPDEEDDEDDDESDD